MKKKTLSSNVICNIGNDNGSYVKTRLDASNFVFIFCNTTDPQKGRWNALQYIIIHLSQHNHNLIYLYIMF